MNEIICLKEEKGMGGNSGEFGIGKALLLGIGVGIIVPIVMFFALRIGSAKEREYVEKGVLTPCYVETILSVGGKQQVWVVYQNEAGKNVKAKAILNKHVGIGETVQAYVLASRPDEVYYPANTFWKIACYIIVGLFAVGSWIPLIVLLIQGHRDKKAAELYEQLQAMKLRNKDNM
jgi:hypothetical protein